MPVSPISFFAIGQKVRLGKWPQMEPYIDQLDRLLEQRRGPVAGLDSAICLNAATMAWSHGDPFDRLLAATALRRDIRSSRPTPCSTEWVARLW